MISFEFFGQFSFRISASPSKTDLAFLADLWYNKDAGRASVPHKDSFFRYGNPMEWKK